MRCEGGAIKTILNTDTLMNSGHEPRNINVQILDCPDCLPRQDKSFEIGCYIRNKFDPRVFWIEHNFLRKNLMNSGHEPRNINVQILE